MAESASEMSFENVEDNDGWLPAYTISPMNAYWDDILKRTWRQLGQIHQSILSHMQGGTVAG